MGREKGKLKFLHNILYVSANEKFTDEYVLDSSIWLTVTVNIEGEDFSLSGFK